MNHILKYSEWQSAGTGKWNCNDVEDLSGMSGYWWVPARMLGMTPAEYVSWLVKNFQPDYLHFDGKTLLYSWDKKNYSKCHALVLYLNKVAREKKFIV